MSKFDAAALAKQIAEVRLEMSANRQAIAARVDSGPRTSAAFPRSRTMQWLIEHRSLAQGLAVGAGVGVALVSVSRVRQVPAVQVLQSVVRFARWWRALA